jgi:hypothetical protein
MRDTIELHRISEKFYQSYCGKISENLPQCTLDASRWQIPDGVDLADPTFAENHPIDILIGADTFWELVMPRKKLFKTARNYYSRNKTRLDYFRRLAKQKSTF